MRFMSMKSPFAKRNGKIWKATDINLVTDEVLGAIRVWKRFNFSAKYLGAKW
jgi:hypothetical protein